MLWILRLAIALKWIAILIYMFTFLIAVPSFSNKTFQTNILPCLLGFHIGSVGTFLLLESFGLSWCCQLTAAGLRRRLVALERSLSAEHPRRASVQDVIEKARKYTYPPGWAPFGRNYEDLVGYLEEGYGHLREARRIARG
jgi:hypothetical protein